ncbi:hypothetical protein R1T08_17090 [Streptomyces sp. SBC-4]|nr:hypothetical protein [Streptomyces sp. SBC-4]MDV5145876.1 hypothetical protein [Streptomyces sp. SBC-4]
MNAKRVQAAEGVILAAMKNRVTAAGVAVALESACLLQSPESASELVRLRSLLDARPLELTGEQRDALSDAGNRAMNDHYHDDLCYCREWPESCATSNYFMGMWDTAAFDIGLGAVLGLWESMRADVTTAPEGSDDVRSLDLLALMPERSAAIVSGHLARLLGEREQLRSRVAELETERHSTNESLSDAAEALRVQRDRIAELETAAARVSALHVKFPDSNHCQYDGERWPCKTLTHVQRPGQMAEQRHLMDPLDHALESLAPHTTSTAGSAL